MLHNSCFWGDRSTQYISDETKDALVYVNYGQERNRIQVGLLKND